MRRVFLSYTKHLSLFLCPDGDIHSLLKDKRASGFQRSYHVTDPFIKRLGLEAELQVIDNGATLFYFYKSFCVNLSNCEQAGYSVLISIWLLCCLRVTPAVWTVWNGTRTESKSSLVTYNSTNVTRIVENNNLTSWSIMYLQFLLLFPFLSLPTKRGKIFYNVY